MKILTLSALAAALFVTGCDMPDKLAAPDPAATWTRTAGLLERLKEASLTLKSDGTFTASVQTDPLEEPKTQTGRWNADKAWQESNCWDRVSFRQESYSRTSRASIGLTYWVAKGTDIPIGAKVIEKRHLSNDASRILHRDSRLNLLTAQIAVRHPTPPAGAQGEHWLVQEEAELIRRTAEKRSSRHLLIWPIEVLGECFGTPDKNAMMTLRFRDRIYALKAT